MRKTATAQRVRRLGTASDAPGPLVLPTIDAFYRADYGTCNALLNSASSVPARDRGWLELVRARIARIEGDVARWATAAASAARLAATPAAKALAVALQAAAAKREGRTAEATRLFSSVRRTLADEPGAPYGEAAYLLAIDAWEDGDLEATEDLIRSTRSMEGNRAERIGLLGWIAVRREAYEAAGAFFAEALQAQATEKPFDVRAQARLLHGAVNVASELPDVAFGRELAVLYDSADFPPALGVENFYILAGLRVVALLEGDVERAWLYARDCAAVAPTPQYAALGETIAAATSLQLGDRNAERVQLARAWAILRGTTWAVSDNEARAALTNFAIDGARTMPAEARKAITLYQSLSARAAPLNTFNDRRLAASEAVAAARVGEALARRDLAIAEYQRAFELWRELGYRVRAAEIALELRRLGAAGEVHETAISELLARAPKAWIRAEAGAAVSPLQKLTPAERVVFTELLAGASAKTIAGKLERSHYTVINHTRRIFAAFGVRSRARLIARCVELGVANEPRGANPLARAAARNGPRNRREKRQQM